MMIAQGAHIGVTKVPEDFRFPQLEFGFSTRPSDAVSTCGADLQLVTTTSRETVEIEQSKTSDAVSTHDVDPELATTTSGETVDIEQSEQNIKTGEFMKTGKTDEKQSEEIIKEEETMKTIINVSEKTTECENNSTEITDTDIDIKQMDVTDVTNTDPTAAEPTSGIETNKAKLTQ